ncbi:GNAT family N-acetyltransferase [Desulfosediminicola sp.]|uniref:GNAT family N-acetyltransferase n=1 Tax=Desulfosediminicola sp. TaxID=2886825 RepID=UPI003AF264B1
MPDNNKIPPIETNRLILKSMSIPLLRMISEGNYEKAQQLSGFVIPPGLPMPNRIWLNRRLEMIERDSSQQKWMYRAILQKNDNRMVGHISFHHKAPDPELLEISELAVELGYTIDPEYRRRGIAKESAIAMMEWANYESNVRTFILTISPANYPSIKLAEAMNFKIIGEHIDEIDGLEYTMMGEIEDVLRTKHA